MSPDRVTEMLGLFERALTLDPHSVEAQSWMVLVLVARAGNGWSESPASDFQRAEELVSRALTASPRDWLTRYAKGTVLKWQGRCEDAIPEYETALALSPNWVNSLNLLAWCKFMTGSIEEAIPFEERAIRLSPSVPYITNLYNEMGIIHLLLLRPDEAIVFWFEKARSPLLGWPYSFLAAIYALRGETEKAAANLAEARRLYPDGRYSSIARRKATGVGGAPGYGGCQRSLPCSKPPTSPACARPACRSNK